MLVFILISLAVDVAKSTASTSSRLVTLSQDVRTTGVLPMNNNSSSATLDNTAKGQRTLISPPRTEPLHSAFIHLVNSPNDDPRQQNNTPHVQGMEASRAIQGHHFNRATNSDEQQSSTSEADGGFKPFSVQIEDKRFYGGLVTYSHDQHPARICRLMNACVRTDGTLVLPEWLKRHDNTLSFHCGHSKLEFSLPDTSPPPSLQRYDLIGLTCPRPSMPHFLHDFMLSAVIFDLVHGGRQVTKSCHSRKGRECDSFPGLIQDFRPFVMLHQRLRALDEKRSWVRQFIKLMKPPKSVMQARVQYCALSSSATEEMQCYRSAFFTRGPYNKNTIPRDHLRNIQFLQSNDIDKRARPVMRAYKLNGKEKKRCHLNVTISNRQLIDGARNRLIGRYVMKIPDLRKAISRQATRISGLRIKVATMTLEGKSLWWQINAMQKTDIWVAGLGSLLTNMVFLRENSTVIELQPFAYYPREYEDMARYLAHVNYERYIAHPDVVAFKTCIHQLYPKGHNAHHKAMGILEKYIMATEKYAKSDSTHSYVISKLNDTAIRNAKTCAQMQRLDTNAKKLAIAVVRHARLRCGLPKPRPRPN